MHMEQTPKKVENLRDAKKRNKKIIRISLLSVIFVFLILALSFDLFGKVDLSKGKEFQDWLESWGIFVYIVFIIVYVICVVLPIPAATMTILSGIMFGAVRGTIVSLIGAVIGATLAFIITRYLLRDYITRKFSHTYLFQKIDEGVEKNGVDFLILTRLVPLFPITLQNYIYGITNMKLVVYVIVSSITMLPGIFLYAYLANDIIENGFGWRTVLIFAVSCISLYILAQLAKHIFRRKGLEIETLTESESKHNALPEN